jgi:hypothetical protein
MQYPVHATPRYALVGCRARRALDPPAPGRRLPERVEAATGRGELRTVDRNMR